MFVAVKQGMFVGVGSLRRNVQRSISSDTIQVRDVTELDVGRIWQSQGAVELHEGR